ncbi:MAG TPA: ATP-binding protein [Ktedonobacteraceae bacterium]|nr:ATP-binding protein [Ktedonobacteraceae bacterium]
MIETSVQKSWREANKDYLVARLEPVRQALKRASGNQSSELTTSETPVEIPTMEAGATPALDMLCALFNLSAFERDILLLCAGVEIDSEFAQLCAAAQGDAQRGYPTFSLVLAALPNPYWFALSPVAPLRYWRFIEIEAGRPPIFSPLRIDERILHYLTGLSYLDRRLADLFQPLSASASQLPSHRAIAREIIAAWSSPVEDEAATLPVIQLCGYEIASKRNIAAAIGSLTGHHIFLAQATALPASASELEEILQLWRREVILNEDILLLDCQGVDHTDTARASIVAHMIEVSTGPLIVTSRERHVWSQRSLLTFDVRKPTSDEQLAIWQAALGTQAVALNGHLRGLVSQFSLDETAIHTIWAGAQGHLAATGQNQPSTGEDIGAELWEMCRAQVRPKLGELAQRIEAAATWEDLVVPDMQRSILQEIAMHVRQRRQVYETWGFASKTTRGLGISALFVGVSGTGKTMAAEALANELHFDLYRIDLSAVVSKYIGETEKNLRRIFDAAEEGGVVLLFDEADALFGKRSEVKDSHDRYANIEVSYLLQRMEAYRGLAILTTNMKDVLDTAFLRRIRFMVQFPFPDAAQRAEIWRRIFPEAAPTEGLDAEKLAQLNIAGGNIRNIALKAAFIAADAGEPIRMRHLLRAARHEYANLEKTLTGVETRGWEI